ncbi:hypothetical protein E4T43_01980 [Aureobasidium subglaciale]|nr:hypothetical protein E4T43_01980 [Aureobasidium subglaciale]
MESMQRRPSQRQNNEQSAQGTPSQDASSLQESSVLVDHPSPEARQTLQIPDDNDLKKCWICFSDESEDGPETSVWRDPCPCALVAHEACLLDWIADLESPTTRKRTIGPPVIACPQCKSNIQLLRPRDAVVEVVRTLERLAAKAVAPAALTVAFSAIVHACAVHGLYTITSIFGPQDSRRILQPLINDIWTAARPIDQLRSFMQHWRLRVGLPLITPLLILSRTTLADSILPVLPIVFFATQGDTSDTLDMISWPPSASMTFAVLPYIRSAYNTFYQRTWAEHEKRWLREIQPRSGQTDTDPNAPLAVDAELEAAEEDANFEIRIDGNIWEDWAGADDADVMFEVQEGEAHPFNAPPLPDHAPLPAQDQQQNQDIPQPPQPPRPQQNPPPVAAQNREERLLSFSTNSLAQTVMSALLFPTIASVSGDLLAQILPLSWTTIPSRTGMFGMTRGKATGLLQNKWGRSVVGGCLFVVAKDAIMLYVRWKMAKQHQSRHVVDYDRKSKR